jgi:hypothetical protein
MDFTFNSWQEATQRLDDLRFLRRQCIANSQDRPQSEREEMIGMLDQRIRDEEAALVILEVNLRQQQRQTVVGPPGKA